MQRVFFLCLFVAGGCAPDLPELVSDTQRDCSVDDDCDTAAFELCVDQRCITDPLAVDNDNDQFTEKQGDCNDDDAGINPDALEVCGDAIDQNCDGTDVACSLFDADRDGVTESNGDCDDTDPDISPALVEICGDGKDNDCSPETDLEPGDTDGDLDCDDADEDNDGYTYNQGDCGRYDPRTYPFAREICGDAIDQNCDGLIPQCDEVDDDGDGYADRANGILGLPGGDCDDGNPLIQPDAIEVCGNTVDEDCDTFSPACNEADEDGDGFAELAGGVLGLPGGDCADDDDRRYPGAFDICGDDIDQNCVPEPDPYNDADTQDRLCPQYVDNDGDGFAELGLLRLGIVGGDCDDTNAVRYPFAPEICNLLDDNCDAVIDEGAFDCNNFDFEGQDLILTGDQFLGGVFLNVGTFSVGALATIYVTRFEDGGSGRLEVRADTITVDGAIDATGIGYGGGGGGGGAQSSGDDGDRYPPGIGGRGYGGGFGGESGNPQYGSSPICAGAGGAGGDGGGRAGGVRGAGGFDASHCTNYTCVFPAIDGGDHGSDGGAGGYFSAGINGDSTQAEEIFVGSGGGGGGGSGGRPGIDGSVCENPSAGLGGGAGSRGGGAILLSASGDLQVDGSLVTTGLVSITANSSKDGADAGDGGGSTGGTTAYGHGGEGGGGGGGGILLRSDSGSITVGGSAILDAMGGGESCAGGNVIEPSGPNGTVKVFAPDGNYTIASIRNRTCAGRLCDGVPDSGICTDR